MGCPYSRKLDPSLSDLAAIWDAGSSSWRASPLSAIKTLFAANETDVTIKEPDSQYAAPVTGATVAITDDSRDVHLILTPVGALAALTVTLPATLRDKQTVLVNCTQDITTLTISGNGATVNGAPTSMTANDFFTLKYDVVVNSWYRVG